MREYAGSSLAETSQVNGEYGSGDDEEGGSDGGCC